MDSIYSIPAGSLEVPSYATTVGKQSLAYICARVWNTTHRELSLKYPNKYKSDPFWLKKENSSSLKNKLKLHFLEHY